MVGVATWSPPTGVDAPHVEPILATAAAVLGAPRAVLAWTERYDDPLHVAFLTGREVTAWDDESWAAEELVAARFAHVDFLCRDAGAPASATTWIADGRLGRRRGAGAVPLAVRHRFAMRSVMAVRLHGERVRGRLFLLDMPDLTADDLVTGGMLARHVERCLEDRVTARRFAAASAAEERVQLGRDVHDGALQSLAGIRLQLEAARRLLVTRPHETESILRELQDVVAVEQHSLRRVVSRLQYAGTLAGHELDHDDLADRITALVLRIERQWSVRMQVLTPIVHADFDAVIPLGLGEEIYQILREALINAARHARATTVMVSLGLEDDAVRLTIVDDGEGFPFTGCYDLPRLIRLDMGPAVLRSRVAGQGGALTIDSSRQGSRLEISIPFQPPVRVSVPAG
jgi:signal transduction histidine kinase